MIRVAAAVRSALDKAECYRKVAEAERLLAEAREADRRKGQFLALLAREFRNPLTPVIHHV